MSYSRFLLSNILLITFSMLALTGCGSESVNSSGILGKLPSLANNGVSKMTELNEDLKSSQESMNASGYADTKKEMDELENSCEADMKAFITEKGNFEVPCFEEGDNGKFTLKNVVVTGATLNKKSARLGMLLKYESKADYPRETYFAHGYFIDSKDQVIGEKVVFASNRGEVKTGQIVEMNGYYDGLENLGDAVMLKLIFGNPYEKK
ncbi:MAG: hypothetical protein IPM56_07110 [Ignavibacteriales bacterium]|nr:MAG: hypothetical protein IPM56_07110 [Ignavibacteriales bacterium]